MENKSIEEIWDEYMKVTLHNVVAEKLEEVLSQAKVCIENYLDSRGLRKLYWRFNVNRKFREIGKLCDLMHGSQI